MNTNNDGDSHGFDHFYYEHNKLTLRIDGEINLSSMELTRFAIHYGAIDYTFAVKNLDGLLFDRLQQKLKDRIIEKYKPTGAQL